MTAPRADRLDDDTIRGLLASARRVAVVGASPRPDRPSHAVLRFLVAAGFDVVAVNPGHAGGAIAGRPVFADLAAASRAGPPIDIVDIFRAPPLVPPVVDAAIRIGARAVWMQLGIVVPEAAEAARRAGLTVVMDRCPAIEWPRLGLPVAPPGPLA